MTSPTAPTPFNTALPRSTMPRAVSGHATSWGFAVLALVVGLVVAFFNGVTGGSFATPMFVVFGMFGLYGLSRIWRALEALSGTRD